MSFVLHLTSRAASGREIVRTRRIEGDVLTVGRDPASDIHLTDLEVTLHHAEIRHIVARVAVNALAAIPLLVDGRSTEHGEIDIARGGEIRIGAARIAISAGEEEGIIAIAVTRDGAQLEGADDAGKRFSLAGTALGKRPMAWTLALFILAIFLAWPIWSFTHAPAKLTDVQMASGYKHIDSSWSSGPLSRAHSSLTRNCKSCHVEAFVAVPDTACTSCHTDIAPHADADRQARAKPQPDGIAGLKLAIADMFGRDPGRCVDCHAEHSGPGAMPAVAETQCAACHADLKTKLPDTKLGDAADFGRVHPQFRPAVMTTPGDYPRFTRIPLGDPSARIQDSGLKFPHALHLSQVSGVARMQATLGRKPLACTECHVPDDSGARFRPVSMERNCSQCHSLAFDRVGGTVRTLRHGNAAQVIADILAAGGGGGGSAPSDRQRPGEIRATPVYSGGGGGAAMVRAIFSPKGACYDCHVIVQPSTPGGLNYRVVPVREQLRFIGEGWFDHAAHTTTTCGGCHAQALTTNDSRILMLPGISTCRQCHGGDTARAPQVRSTCAMCHDYHRGNGAPHALRSGKMAAKGGGRNADSPDFGSALGIRSRRSGRDERAPP
ncbi:cytochrome c3 family protein [Sphingomonas bacterium]|uniref:cytochrome c3 family protein n=1 Tax=Sphingomonas bacterium TaxID=1895847 RepID=UPI0026061E19|nr:cytochrome c3 family protein [Sphingomonas bacterium]MDB5678852.1 hypothetical protein [Sphingomonas bacterium]